MSTKFFLSSDILNFGYVNVVIFVKLWGGELLVKKHVERNKQTKFTRVTRLIYFEIPYFDIFKEAKLLYQ